VFVFDARGIGNRFDPLAGRESEDELRAMAEYLLAEPNETHGLIFIKRAVKMFTQLFKPRASKDTRLFPTPAILCISG